MALSNAWGTFLIIFLMGYGLVEIPKYLLNLTDFRNRIKYLEWKTKLNSDYINIRTNEFIELFKKLESIESIPLLTTANSINHREENKEEISKYFQFLNLDDNELEKILYQFKSKFNYESLIEISYALKFNKNEITKLSSEIASIYSEWYTLSYLFNENKDDENYFNNQKADTERKMSLDILGIGRVNPNLKNINNMIITNYNNNKIGFEKYKFNFNQTNNDSDKQISSNNIYNSFNESLSNNLNQSNISYKSEYSFLREKTRESNSIDSISK